MGSRPHVDLGPVWPGSLSGNGLCLASSYSFDCPPPNSDGCVAFLGRFCLLDSNHKVAHLPPRTWTRMGCRSAPVLRASELCLDFLSNSFCMFSPLSHLLLSSATCIFLLFSLAALSGCADSTTPSFSISSVLFPNISSSFIVRLGLFWLLIFPSKFTSWHRPQL